MCKYPVFFNFISLNLITIILRYIIYIFTFEILRFVSIYNLFIYLPIQNILDLNIHCFCYLYYNKIFIVIYGLYRLYILSEHKICICHLFLSHAEQ